MTNQLTPETEKFRSILAAVATHRKERTGQPGDANLREAEERYVAFRMLTQLGRITAKDAEIFGERQYYITRLASEIEQAEQKASTAPAPGQSSALKRAGAIVNEVDGIIVKKEPVQGRHW